MADFSDIIQSKILLQSWDNYILQASNLDLS